jgi:branched-chain amino acid transport system substrate-binding protein
VTKPQPLSRREFLKLAAKAGAIVGLGAGVGGMLAACKETGDTPNTIATIGTEETTTTTAPRATTSTVTTGPQTGRYLRIGLVSAKTARLALFGRADEWWLERAQTALPDGVLCGDATLRKFIFLVQDSKSDPALAAEGAARVISEGKADILLCSGAADMVNPAAAQAESLGCPCLSSFVQWRPFVFGRGGTLETPFKWTYAHAIGLEDIAGNYMAMWEQVKTNRKAGLLFSDDAGGRTWTDEAAGLPAAATAAGYEPTLPGLYPVGTVDFSAHISEFMKNGCEICCGAMRTADFIAFWQQAQQLGFRPKVVTMSEALLFPQALEAVGSSALNLTAESLWQPDWPYSDSVSGDSAQALAADYMDKIGEQWIAPIAQYAKFEWAVDVFKRVRDVDSKDAIVRGIKTTRLDTCLGPIDFVSAVGTADPNTSRRPTENVYKAPVGGIQWIEGGSFAYQPTTVANVGSPALAITGSVRPMAYGPA